MGTMLSGPDVDAEQQRQLRLRREQVEVLEPHGAARLPSAGRRRWRTCMSPNRAVGVAPLATRTAVAGVSGGGVTMSCM